VLYRLLETPQAPALFEQLGGAGIYVRRFQHDPSRLRFGLPGSESEWHRLAEALASA
jgi:cobalamin biosynthetic protein CobC